VLVLVEPGIAFSVLRRGRGRAKNKKKEEAETTYNYAGRIGFVVF